MTKKELTVILKALSHAQDVIEYLACENHPWTAFEDQEMSNLFYQLNDMCITVNKKLEAAR